MHRLVLTLIGVIVLLVALGGRSFGAPPSTGPQQVVEVPQDVTDARIEKRLTEILSSTEWFEGESVKVKNGVAYLTGVATEPQSKEWAGELASKTEGVVGVVNRLEAKQDVDFGNAISLVGSSMYQLWKNFLNHLPLLIAGIVVLFLTWLASRITVAVVRRASGRTRIRDSLRDLFLQLTTITAWLVGILVAAVIVFPGMTPAKVLTVLGLSSVAIGFAFKDIFENFFAGVLILWRFPFDKGDFVTCGDVEGKVEDITIRMTMIRQVDGQLVVVPNAMLFKSPVNVLTNSPKRRVTVICGVGYAEDIDAAREVISTAVRQCDSVESQKPVEIFAREFADSSVNFEVTWWTGSTPAEIRQSRDEVVAAVKSSLDSAGIEIPFPYRTLTFQKPIEVATSSAQG